MVNHRPPLSTATDQADAQLWLWLAAIPAGRVTSYGRLAALAGRRGSARWVGRQLSQLPADSALPWHRVVNSRGVIVPRCGAEQQRQRLLAEGVAVCDDRVALRDYLWQPQ
ncbi:hypothetical protein E3W66_00285 [Gammaproteobacteria bacterium LSUCC0057]|jgi:methylated-DNA-protein-cysteine methyltransferase-like protein|uniref:Methylated-DNA-[protein]-cysteine S-methyltransferase DNA binding domain-containing protein n=1 Tax=Gammaproteobacteria bacterium LSUCC0057 TaxID=2559237 RepID=A0A4Y8UHV7_9GAMM|nr:hypothetical protein E3W66_00285 [Gammaproteobacteria bacterium LSUCC0057]